jgi:ubiquinone/menaquinone biosynthesis C-methylase UbiE
MASRKSTASYDPRAAEQFWSQRLKSTTPLAAVLTYNARPEINLAYDQWEKGLLAAYLKHRPAIRHALDLGAGVGRISLLLASRKIDVVALDNSREMLAQLARTAKKAKLSGRITTVHALSTESPLADRSCDLVICFGLLEHLPEPERNRTIKEAARVVTKSGRILVVVNNLHCPFLQKKYPLKTQRPDGYFVSLVGLEWLEKQAGRLKLKHKVIGANPAYAHIQYVLEPGFQSPALSRRELTAICNSAVRSDLANRIDAAFAARFASHFIVELRRA